METIFVLSSWSFFGKVFHNNTSIKGWVPLLSIQVKLQCFLLKKKKTKKYHLQSVSVFIHSQCWEKIGCTHCCTHYCTHCCTQGEKLRKWEWAEEQLRSWGVIWGHFREFEGRTAASESKMTRPLEREHPARQQQQLQPHHHPQIFPFAKDF